MDASRFDQLAKALSTPGTRRGALGALLGTALGLLGVLGLPETEIVASKKRQHHRRQHGAKAKKRGKDISAQGPCGNGRGPANSCRSHADCSCSGYCHKRIRRCRCKKLAETCTENRNCCAAFGQPMACQNGTCQTVLTVPPPPSPVSSRCQPEPVSQTCAGRCGIAANTCGNPIDCGGCPVCQTCSGGVCAADPSQQRNVCAGSGSQTSICCNGVCCDGCCSSDGSCGSCRVFATSTVYTGNLGGLDGAAAKCQERAQIGNQPGGNVPGTYQAWLSDSSDSPSTRFRRSAQPYRLPNGADIASSYAALVAGPDIATKLEWTELGTRFDALPGEVVAWTNTRPDGTPGGSDAFGGSACPNYLFNLHCMNWGSDAAGQFGCVGDTEVTHCAWTSLTTAACANSNSRHLYCFQQT